VLRDKGIPTSRETALRPYKKRMECDQAKMISRRLEEELTTAREVGSRTIPSARARQKRAKEKGGMQGHSQGG